MAKPKFSRAAIWVLVAGSLILAISTGMRHGFGIFLQPMSLDHSWGREVFSFAIAIQNIVWGLAQPFAGMLADRYGAGKTIVVGALLYCAGLALMAISHTGLAFSLSAGVLVGLGLAGTTFSVVFGAVGRVAAPEHRAVALGIAGAVASIGQFILSPVSLALIEGFSWPIALFGLAILAAFMVPLAFPMMERAGSAGPPEMTAREALREASRHSGFWLLSFGFFVCGFQVVFIGVHLPAFLVDQRLPNHVGTTALALVGLFNVVGSFVSGMVANRIPKPYLLSLMYGGRGVFVALFIFTPITATSAYIFAIAMGLVWLATVPLTNGVVATIFGVRNLSMLGGIVFMFHQIGAFLGGWLGGLVFDATGSYDTVWFIVIGLSVLATMLNLPIKEVPIPSLTRAKARAQA
ncbi:MAG: MFS transporter [Alphaproteobacteria bacterium]